jgi:hypothetical protein
VVRFILALAPVNRTKVLKQLGLLRGWFNATQVGTVSLGPGTLYGYGVISDDERLCEITEEQGDEALYTRDYP